MPAMAWEALQAICASKAIGFGHVVSSEDNGSVFDTSFTVERTGVPLKGDGELEHVGATECKNTAPGAICKGLAGYPRQCPKSSARDHAARPAETRLKRAYQGWGGFMGVAKVPRQKKTKAKTSRI